MSPGLCLWQECGGAVVGTALCGVLRRPTRFSLISFVFDHRDLSY